VWLTSHPSEKEFITNRVPPSHRFKAAMNKKPKKGFSIVEIMIVVSIIGILVAIAIPNFLRLRNNSTAKIIVQEGRQIAGAAQHYLMRNSATSVSFEVDPRTGLVSGPLVDYVSKISPNITYEGGPITGDKDFQFSLKHSFGSVTFSMEGKPLDASGDLADDVYNQ
jgi:prepilin-type N-terminal cleavage/methylation domain-containing protein